MSHANYLSLWRRNHKTQLEVLNYCHDSCEEIISLDSPSDKGEEMFEGRLDLNVEVSASASSSDVSDVNSIYISENDGIHIQDNLASELSSWACENHLTRRATNHILLILRNHGHKELPKDSRTLLSTPRNVSLKQKCGGDYFYIGLSCSIKSKLEKFSSHDINSLKTINLLINIDGIPLFKSSNTQLWPILASFQPVGPFVVALYCGSSKPNSCEEFLKEFLEEYRNLEVVGLHYNEKKINVNITGFICDAPARQFLKGIKSHTGYDACERCKVYGEHIENRMVFHDLDCEPRIDQEFKQIAYTGHQLLVSPLIRSSVQCIKDFCLDYMHLVCLRVVKRLLLYLKEGPRCCRISSNQFNVVSDSILSYYGKMPSEFARQPRGLSELRRWKATEFRQFLIYTGIIALKGTVSLPIYINFLSLSVAIRIMLEENQENRNEHLEYAHKLLVYFVASSRELYSDSFCSYNVHSLIHLHNDVSNFGCNLDQISCFPFENYLNSLKRFIRQANNPISQVVKRIHEFEINNAIKVSKDIVTKISTNKKDNCFVLHSREIIFVTSIIDINTFVCKIFHKSLLRNYFPEPFDSNMVGIYFLCKSNIGKRKIVNKVEIKRKVACLPVNDGVVLCTLLNDVVW